MCLLQINDLMISSRVFPETVSRIYLPATIGGTIFPYLRPTLNREKNKIMAVGQNGATLLLHFHFMNLLWTLLSTIDNIYGPRAGGPVHHAGPAHGLHQHQGLHLPDGAGLRAREGHRQLR